MVKGGRTRDLPGLKYKLMRGKEDFDWRESFIRKNKLTKYLYPKVK
jgi:ribosomal protein S12